MNILGWAFIIVVVYFAFTILLQVVLALAGFVVGSGLFLADRLKGITTPKGEGK